MEEVACVFCQRSTVFYLAHGTIFYEPETKPDDDTKGIPEHFEICNLSGARPIQLYRSELVKLAQLLPKAYLAYKEADSSFCLEIKATKSERVTLEVSQYNEKMYLFLKKSFKPQDKVDDPDQEWIHTKSNVSFDPDKDNASQLLKYASKCK